MRCYIENFVVVHVLETDNLVWKFTTTFHAEMRGAHLKPKREMLKHHCFKKILIIINQKETKESNRKQRKKSLADQSTPFKNPEQNHM